mgnify:CR=1 FL=1
MKIMSPLHISLVVLLYQPGEEGRIKYPNIVLWRTNEMKDVYVQAGAIANSLPRGAQLASLDECLQTTYPVTPIDRLRNLLRKHLGDQFAGTMDQNLEDERWQHRMECSHKLRILNGSAETHFLLIPYADLDLMRVNPTRIAVDFASPKEIEKMKKKTASARAENKKRARDPRKALAGTPFAGLKGVKISHISLSDAFTGEDDIGLAEKAFGLIEKIFGPKSEDSYREWLAENPPKQIGGYREAVRASGSRTAKTAPHAGTKTKSANPTRKTGRIVTPRSKALSVPRAMLRRRGIIAASA